VENHTCAAAPREKETAEWDFLLVREAYEKATGNRWNQSDAEAYEQNKICNVPAAKTISVLKVIDRREEKLFERVAEIIESARGRVARTANSAMVPAYWLIGKEIVEVEQHGKERADYGDKLMSRLAERLTSRSGKGFERGTERAGGLEGLF
jgi:hypothetical protein